jgi:hypothetical protein
MKRYEMRRWRWALLVLVAAASFVARPAEAKKPKRVNRCYAVHLETDARDRRGRDTVVSASESRDLRIEVSLPEELSSLPVEVKLFTPRGTLYQVLPATADASSSSEAGKKRRRPRHRGRSLTALVPLAGTQITTYALFGEWRAEAYVDGADSPCTRPLEFVIEP